MKIAKHSLWLAALLAAGSATSWAQQAPSVSAPPKPETHEQMRAHMHARMEQRAAELKAKLKLAPEQKVLFDANTKRRFDGPMGHMGQHGGPAPAAH